MAPEQGLDRKYGNSLSTVPAPQFSQYYQRKNFPQDFSRSWYEEEQPCQGWAYPQPRVYKGTPRHDNAKSQEVLAEIAKQIQEAVELLTKEIKASSKPSIIEPEKTHKQGSSTMKMALELRPIDGENIEGEPHPFANLFPPERDPPWSEPAISERLRPEPEEEEVLVLPRNIRYNPYFNMPPDPSLYEPLTLEEVQINDESIYYLRCMTPSDSQGSNSSESSPPQWTKECAERTTQPLVRPVTPKIIEVSHTPGQITLCVGEHTEQLRRAEDKPNAETQIERRDNPQKVESPTENSNEHPQKNSAKFRSKAQARRLRKYRAKKRQLDFLEWRVNRLENAVRYLLTRTRLPLYVSVGSRRGRTPLHSQN